MAPDPRPIEPTDESTVDDAPAMAERQPEPTQPEPTELDPAGASLLPAPDELASPDDPATAPATRVLDDRADPSAASTRSTSGAVDRDVIVAMHGVSHRFDDGDVLSGVDLTVPRGTILGIIGPSGAGKTTTIRLLTGGLSPTTGEVSVMGRAPKRFRRTDRERIGYMPQSFALYEDLTAGENIDFVASLFGMLWRRRRRRVREVLKIVDLWGVRGRQAGQLSGGMQRRLALACALVHDPELIILDEPTAGIDPLLRGSIWRELHRLRDAGRTLLVTTQHVSEADECDSVAMIVGGRIIALAPPAQLRRLATNGDLLDIETAAIFDGDDLTGKDGVRAVTQDGPRHLRVVVADAGSSLPAVVERIRASGVDVVSAREQRLSFDEIFAILVARNDEQRAAEEANAAADPADRTGGPTDRSKAAA
jgi:ABC-2 type transport system ATP-binding protein